MFNAKAHLRSRGSVRTELVRDHHARWRDGGFQEFLHEPLRSVRVSSALHQDVEHEAILIDGAPQPMLLARDRDNNFVQVPLVAATRRAPSLVRRARPIGSYTPLSANSPTTEPYGVLSSCAPRLALMEGSVTTS